MSQPTDKQISYRSSLIAEIAAAAPLPIARPSDRWLAHANLAMALSLPTPATVAECSAQIDALKDGFVAWGKRNRAEGEALLAKLVAAIPADAAPSYDPMAYLIEDGLVRRPDYAALRADFRATVAAALFPPVSGGAHDAEQDCLADFGASGDGGEMTGDETRAICADCPPNAAKLTLIERVCPFTGLTTYAIGDVTATPLHNRAPHNGNWTWVLAQAGRFATVPTRSQAMGGLLAADVASGRTTIEALAAGLPPVSGEVPGSYDHGYRHGLRDADGYDADRNARFAAELERPINPGGPDHAPDSYRAGRIAGLRSTLPPVSGGSHEADPPPQGWATAELVADDERNCAACEVPLFGSEGPLCEDCRDTEERIARWEEGSDDEDDADIMARISDHDPADTEAGRQHDLFLDGQRWACDQPAEAEKVVHELGRTNAGNADRQSWLRGVAHGLAVGTRGLRPRMEALEDDATDPQTFTGVTLADCICGGTQVAEISGDLYQDAEGGWHVGTRRIPCPDCTAEGAALVEAEGGADETAYWAQGAADETPREDPYILDYARWLAANPHALFAGELAHAAALIAPPRSMSDLDIALRAAV